MQYPENNKKIIEKQLILVLEKICDKLKISLDQWKVDGNLIIDDVLFNAIDQHKQKQKVKDLIQQYDDLFYLEPISQKIAPNLHKLRKLNKK